MISMGSPQAQWTDDEIDAAVEAYVLMYREELGGRDYNKSETRRRYLAGPLAGRNDGAFERRMQNITAMLRRFWGVDGIKGYVPLPRTGVGKAELIREALLRRMPELADIVDVPATLQTRIAVARDQIRASEVLGPPPTGNRAPKRKPGASTVIERSVAVAAYVLEHARGVCECCGCAAPFMTEAGEPFLEVHHVKRLASGGPDVFENSVALCPNCHREAHYGPDIVRWAAAIRQRVGRLLEFD